MLALSAYGNDMDVEHNACKLGRASWQVAAGALIHTHTEHNHTCGELEDRAFIVTTHRVYAFRQWFRLPTGSLTGSQIYSQSADLGLGSQRIWDWVW